MKHLFLFLLMIVLSNTAFAVELKIEIAKCASIEGELARLNCYDKLADTAGVSKKKVTNQKKAGKWTLEIDKNPVDDSKTVVGVLDAKNGVSKWGKPISMLLRCKSKETDAFIVWGSYLGDDSPQVLIRIGDAEAETGSWHSSNDKTATFYPGDSIEFIEKLQTAKKFVAQVTPYMENPVTAVFDLSGIEKVTRAIRETCAWPKQETPDAESKEAAQN